MVGNGVTDYKYDGLPASFEMAYYFGLIDDALYFNVHNAGCDLTHDLSGDCLKWINQFYNLTSKINPYDYLGVCYNSTTFEQYQSA